MGICEGRVVIVTGAGRGLGRAYALELARQGASVVVNDLGVSNHGEDMGESPADAVVSEITAAGGKAIANHCDVADWDATRAMVDEAIDTFGGLHAVVNNAGFVRDRMFVSATPDEWDAIMHVHLRGHFCTARHAADYWRGLAKEGKSVDARIVNTTSGAGLHGSIGQTAYSTAKGGIATMTLVQAAELGRYGITANALAPNARTRMTEGAFGEAMSQKDGDFDIFAPENTAPLIAWLCSDASAKVSGQVFELIGGNLRLCLGWSDGPQEDAGRAWQADEIGSAVDRLLAERPAAKPVWGTS
ncbi:SDR family oxidoreductase [Thalassorhabdomicrobium marinisediminis]|uniref:Short-chain dehydrogenase n=1 Tax=Thalassorhabdomicrobium marinisediminis TaxID=2170577 RepID=A0A2T7FU68_9RHOB|nr:SDR family oxidoreductase [Thalassorhabdomicrobium marinisediminis]PVA05717.1 short-chain dehydrogenase [Thalassorhabdomicrobium marinisediminis]